MSLTEASLVGIYLIAILLIGLSARRKESPGEFLIGDRRMGTIPVAASISALIGGGYLGALAAISFEYGLGVFWYTAGNLFGLVLLAILVPRIKSAADKNSSLTMADYFFDRFDRVVGTVVAIIVYLAFLCLLGMQYIIGGTIFSRLFSVPFEGAVVAMGVYTAFYLLLGGFKAVIKTDMLQFAIMFAIFIVAVPASLGPSGWISTLQAGSLQVAPIGFLHIVSFLFAGMAGMIAAADVWTRLYAAKSSKAARSATFLAAGMFALFGFSLALIGVLARLHDPALGSDSAFTTGLFQALPPALLSIATVAILAALMSTIDTELFMLSTNFAKDFGTRLLGWQGSEIRITRTIRRAIIGNTLVSMALAIYGPGLIEVGWIFSTLIVALAPTIVVSLYRPVSSQVALISIVGGALSTLPFALVGALNADLGPLISGVGATLFLAGGLIFTTRARIDPDYKKESFTPRRKDAKRGTQRGERNL